MVKPAQQLKISQCLEQLRLESECTEMAHRARDPDLQAHFMRMARNWNRLATTALDESEAGDLRETEAVAI